MSVGENVMFKKWQFLPLGFYHKYNLFYMSHWRITQEDADVLEVKG